MLEKTNPQNKEFRKISFVEDSEFLTYREWNTNFHNMIGVKEPNVKLRNCWASATNSKLPLLVASSIVALEYPWKLTPYDENCGSYTMKYNNINMQ